MISGGCGNRWCCRKTRSRRKNSKKGRAQHVPRPQKASSCLPIAIQITRPLQPTRGNIIQSDTCEISGVSRILSLARPTKWRWPARPFGGVDCPTEQYTGFCNGYTAPDASYTSTGRNPSVVFNIESLARIILLSKKHGTGSKMALKTARTGDVGTTPYRDVGTARRRHCSSTADIENTVE